MVRTRANNAAMRKAVVAKAPRKQLAPSRPLGPVSPGGGKSKKGAKIVGGNPAKVWPTPAWQKGIQTFLAGGDGGECSSSANTSLTSEPEEQLTSSKEMEMDSEGQCSGGSSSAAVGVSLLDGDIAQLHSEDEGD